MHCIPWISLRSCKFTKCWVAAAPGRSARDKGAFVPSAVCRILVLMSLQLFSPAVYSYLDQLSKGWNEQYYPSLRLCVASEQ